jgi:hypothetical protein
MEIFMTNVGNLDRTIRIVVGALLLIMFFVPQLGGLFAGLGALKYVVPIVGAVLLATGAIRICPAYSVFGIKT